MVEEATREGGGKTSLREQAAPPKIIVLSSTEFTPLAPQDYTPGRSVPVVEEATKGDGTTSLRDETSLREQAAPPKIIVLSSTECTTPAPTDNPPARSVPVVEEATNGDGTTSLREQRWGAPQELPRRLPSIELPPPESGAPVAGETAHEPPPRRRSGPESS